MKILLAEDEAQLARVLVTAITSQGYQIDTAANGQEAVDLAAKNAYDVMILDIMMPVRDGLSALREIRARGNRAYVIMLTAMAEVDDRVTGLDSGADDYLTKPFSLKELLARLRSLARRTSNYETDQLKFANVTLDHEEQRLEGHNSIALSGKETRLLAYLIMNAEKSLPADQLLAQGWDEDDHADQEDLWIYISYLRQKLRAVNAQVTLEGAKGGPYTLTQTGGAPQ